MMEVNSIKRKVKYQATLQDKRLKSPPVLLLSPNENEQEARPKRRKLRLNSNEIIASEEFAEGNLIAEKGGLNETSGALLGLNYLKYYQTSENCNVQRPPLNNYYSPPNSSSSSHPPFLSLLPVNVGQLLPSPPKSELDLRCSIIPCKSLSALLEKEILYLPSLNYARSIRPTADQHRKGTL